MDKINGLVAKVKAAYAKAADKPVVTHAAAAIAGLILGLAL